MHTLTQHLNGFSVPAEKEQMGMDAMGQSINGAMSNSSSFVMPQVDYMMDYIITERIEAQESKAINPNSNLSSALNSRPKVWIDATFRHFGLSTKAKKRENLSLVEYFKDAIRRQFGKKREKVDGIVAYLTNEERLASVVGGLPKASWYALKFVIEHGGCVEIDKLQLFRDITQDGWYWVDKPPTTPLGRLRLRGLLFIGKAGVNGKQHTVAVIPEELRQPLRKILAAGFAGGKPLPPA